MSARLKAFLIHALFSIGIALIVIGIVFFIWYPAPLAKAVGVTNIFFMMLGIDVILGPLLTWVVYKQGKKTLIFDLTVIVILQVSALGYGLWTISQGRPVWLVYNVDRFDSVRVNDIDSRGLAKAKVEYRNPSWIYPQWIGATASNNTEENNKIIFESVFSGIDIPQRPERYVSLSEVKLQIQNRKQNLELLQQYNNSQQVKNVLGQYPQATAFVPLKANVVDMVVLLDKNNDVIKIVDLRPWK
ncbi:MULTISPECIES: TfpX/TfpZ family type IV pilin accessory protein [unclassified Acinetobacter]|uniref:TfpX/TfpZ family type IV pilin accessory protein n=1 Tax=unclassified Acinetobacter TaxID=196816 RepID=UPI002449F513|nr:MULTISPECIES: TfpX/TfpZ family type IV pilin accessory protein [unclassified Acinetobacter]MDH0029844.1 type IV pilin accessory protein [Acinetobacter sp. GD04021]MDH0885392.1 type IV pilin accessory protein [Acinetobacter sp. GD03873]MDH1081510.1 type IV pilin accessory protein [Acinetobacter sp. GD03983]MDH2188709.1 type IV pilin accessory protein [Acinetobacter sp. GD03645]MDH2203432.1 type IV pilin accessory protein [Acinetobacter sp. GD03647]